MRPTKLFAVSKGQKVTEKHLLRVLTASICCIVLCMSCLAGTTWALFAASIENTENVINIGTPTVVMKLDDQILTSGAELTGNTHKLHIAHGNEPDDLQQKSTLYVILTFENPTTGDTRSVYKTLNKDNQYEATVEIEDCAGFLLRWEVAWFAPVNAIELIDGEITLGDHKGTEETTEPTETETEPTESTTEPTETETEPTESTTEPTETETEPTESTTEPTETETEPTESTTEPTETETEPTESTTEPTEKETEPTESTTEPTEKETKSDEGGTESDQEETESTENADT